MASRHSVMALSKNKEDKYIDATNELREIIAIFKNMTIGRGGWKPIQTGVILSTTTVLELAEKLLQDKVSFLMTGRLTQDCLENLFSVVRSKNPVPSCLESQRVLKTICTAQFMRKVKHSSYDEDDSLYLADFLDNKPSEDSQPSKTTQPFDDIEEVVVVTEGIFNRLDELDESSLYYITGCSSNTSFNK